MALVIEPYNPVRLEAVIPWTGSPTINPFDYGAEPGWYAVIYGSSYNLGSLPAAPAVWTSAYSTTTLLSAGGARAAAQVAATRLLNEDNAEIAIQEAGYDGYAGFLFLFSGGHPKIPTVALTGSGFTGAPITCSAFGENPQFLLMGAFGGDSNLSYSPSTVMDEAVLSPIVGRQTRVAYQLFGETDNPFGYSNVSASFAAIAGGDTDGIYFGVRINF